MDEITERPMQKSIAEFWYGIESCEDNIVHLREAWIDPYLAGDIWLVRGSHRDILVDTGTGIVSPEPIVRAITGRPVLALACNPWYDHAGGLHCFADRGCHRLDAGCIASPTPESSLVSTFVDDRMFIAYPHRQFDARAYRMPATEPTVLLSEGDVIHLGNRDLEVMHLPGMTPGSIALWESKTGSLFTSDTIYDDPGERPLNPADHSAFAASLERLSSLPVTTVYGGHFGRFGRTRLLDLIAGYLRGEHRTERLQPFRPTL